MSIEICKLYEAAIRSARSDLKARMATEHTSPNYPTGYAGCIFCDLKVYARPDSSFQGGKTVDDKNIEVTTTGTCAMQENILGK